MMVDLGVVADRPFTVIFYAAALIVTKAGIIMGLASWFGMKWRQALALGLLLSQGGECAFVLFAEAQRGMLIDADAATCYGDRDLVDGVHPF